MVNTTERLIGYPEIASMIGVGVATVREYNTRARRHRAAGINRESDLPAPNHFYGNSPAWKESVIKQWMKVRQNHPGRPRSAPRPRVTSKGK